MGRTNTMEIAGSIFLIVVFGVVLMSCCGTASARGFLAAIEHRGAIQADQVAGMHGRAVTGKSVAEAEGVRGLGAEKAAP